MLAPPEVQAEARPGTMLAQPEVQAEARPGTMLAQPEVQAEARPGTMLAQPEVQAEARPGTMVGQPEALAARPATMAGRPEVQAARPTGALAAFLWRMALRQLTEPEALQRSRSAEAVVPPRAAGRRIWRRTCPEHRPGRRSSGRP
jgi:hypothetical protein